MLASPACHICLCLPDIHQVNYRLKTPPEKTSFKNCNYICHPLFLRSQSFLFGWFVFIFNSNILTSLHLSSSFRTTAQVCCSRWWWQQEDQGVLLVLVGWFLISTSELENPVYGFARNRSGVSRNFLHCDYADHPLGLFDKF